MFGRASGGDTEAREAWIECKVVPLKNVAVLFSCSIYKQHESVQARKIEGHDQLVRRAPREHWWSKQ